MTSLYHLHVRTYIACDIIKDKVPEGLEDCTSVIECMRDMMSLGR